MNLTNDHIYHIYNQGNNKQKIFFKRGNYLFFINKIRAYFSPYCDILAWCLMPNHFHFMVLVNEVNRMVVPSQSLTQSQTLTNQNQTLTKRSFNDAIGIALRSYTRAINKQEGISGSLFRKATKAQCITCPRGINSSWFNENGITRIKNFHPDKDYPKVCFDYIHQNPVKAGLVRQANDWEFSSAKDYAGLRDDKLINKSIAQHYGLL